MRCASSAGLLTGLRGRGLRLGGGPALLVLGHKISLRMLIAMDKHNHIRVRAYVRVHKADAWRAFSHPGPWWAPVRFLPGSRRAAGGCQLQPAAAAAAGDESCLSGAGLDLQEKVVGGRCGGVGQWRVGSAPPSGENHVLKASTL